MPHLKLRKHCGPKTTDMLVVISTHSGDIQSSIRLLNWIKRLGGTSSHDLLIVSDAGTPFDQAVKCKEIAEGRFREVRMMANRQSVVGWPDGANDLFRTASAYILKEWPQPFLWLEPDSVPMRSGWLDEISAEYAKCGKRYMGHIYQNDDPRYPKLLMSGIAVYPEDANRELFLVDYSPLAWDVDCAHIMVGSGHNTKLVSHFWGTLGKPPTFSHEAVPNTNIFSLNTIPESCAIWHRVKDSSLIDLLREKLFNERDCDEEMLVVLPFCNIDWQRMLNTVEWMSELHPHSSWDALLSYQDTTDRESVRKIRKMAQKAFRSVLDTSYAGPPQGAAPQTWAWRHAAMHVYHEIQRPWFWCEADLIPMSTGWLEKLQDVYRKRGKPFAGPRVKGMSHANGTSIYPWNTPEYLPKTINAIGNIWDVYSAPEMMPHCADIGDICFHAWGVLNGRLHPFVGSSPDFGDEKLYRQIPATAVCVHRSKDGRLIERLRTQRKMRPA